MSDELGIFRFTQEAYDQLRLVVAKESPETYLDPDADFEAILAARGIGNYAEPTNISAIHPIGLTPSSDGPPHRADVQALDFYRSLVDMTPRTATDERMWAWLTHFKLHRYSLGRWRRTKNTVPTNYVRSHWFVDNRAEGLKQYNTAARTWWIAHTANKAANASAGAFTVQEALQDFATNAVHYHILMTKYSFARCPQVLAELVRVLLQEAQGMKAEAGLYAVMKRLNLISGTRILDLLPRSELRAAIVEIVDEIMSEPEMVSGPHQAAQSRAVSLLESWRWRAINRSRVDGRSR